MKTGLIFLAGFFILIGCYLVFNPDFLFDTLERNSSERWVYLSAIGMRLIFGILLIKCADESKFPLALKTLGYIGIAAAVIFIFIGPNHFENLMNSVLPQVKPMGRMGGIFSIILGGFITYAMLGNKKHDSQ